MSSTSSSSGGNEKSGDQPKTAPNVEYAVTLARPAGMITSDSKSGEL